MAAAPRKRVRAPWIWCRAFGLNRAATWGGPKVEIAFEVTLGLCNPMSVGQRLLLFASVTSESAPGHRAALRLKLKIRRSFPQERLRLMGKEEDSVTSSGQGSECRAYGRHPRAWKIRIRLLRRPHRPRSKALRPSSHLVRQRMAVASGW